MISAEADGEIRVWNSDDATLRQVLSGHKSSVWRLIASDRHLISAEQAGELREWRLRPRVSRVLEGHTREVAEAVFERRRAKTHQDAAGFAVRARSVLRGCQNGLHNFFAHIEQLVTHPRGDIGIAQFVEFSVYLGLVQDPLRSGRRFDGDFMPKQNTHSALSGSGRRATR